MIQSDRSQPRELLRRPFRSIIIAEPARTLLPKVHAPLGLSGLLLPVCFRNPGRSTAPARQRDWPDATRWLFEPYPHGRIIGAALRGRGRRSEGENADQRRRFR